MPACLPEMLLHGLGGGTGPGPSCLTWEGRTCLPTLYYYPLTTMYGSTYPFPVPLCWEGGCPCLCPIILYACVLPIQVYVPSPTSPTVTPCCTLQEDVCPLAVPNIPCPTSVLPRYSVLSFPPLPFPSFTLPTTSSMILYSVGGLLLPSAYTHSPGSWILDPYVCSSSPCSCYCIHPLPRAFCLACSVDGDWRPGHATFPFCPACLPGPLPSSSLPAVLACPLPLTPSCPLPYPTATFPPSLPRTLPYIVERDTTCLPFPPMPAFPTPTCRTLPALTHHLHLAFPTRWNLVPDMPTYFAHLRPRSQHFLTPLVPRFHPQHSDLCLPFPCITFRVCPCLPLWTCLPCLKTFPSHFPHLYLPCCHLPAFPSDDCLSPFPTFNTPFTYNPSPWPCSCLALCPTGWFFFTCTLCPFPPVLLGHLVCLYLLTFPGRLSF